MSLLVSVSKFIGKNRTRTRRTPQVQHVAQENEGSQSKMRVVADPTPSTVISAISSSEVESSKANSQPETLPKEQDFSFPPSLSRKSEVTKSHERKTEAFEEPGYDVVLQPSAKASFGDWTELNTEQQASHPAAKDFDAELAQSGIDHNEEDEPLAKSSNATNWTPFDIGEKAGAPLRQPSLPDLTHLEIDEKPEEPSAKVKPSDAEWLQLDIDEKKKEEEGDVAVLAVEDNRAIMLETRLQEERAEHLEELRIVTEAKEKLAERVKELEEELHQAEHELQLKMEQISKFIVDFYRKEEEIEGLKGEKERIQQEAKREKQESLDEVRAVRLLNEVLAAERQDAKDAETIALMAKQDDIQVKFDAMTEDLSKSQERAAELESANELQAKKILEQDTTLASHSEVIAGLRGQKADLITQVHTLRANATVKERQNSMLMIQLRQQSDDIVAWKGTTSSVAIIKPVRRTTGPTLVAQAVRTIKALNEEIYQTAASLTDCVDEIEKRFVEQPDDMAAALELESLKSLLGTEIYNELEDQSCMMKDEYNPFVLQTGFQACLIACCMRIITSWYPAEPEYGKFLEAVHERIRVLGGTENAAQWRKWTIQSCALSTNAGMKSALFDCIADNLYAMLSMSGWPKSGKTTNLLDKFNGKISEIVNLALRLNALATETTIPNLIATTIEGGKDYVSQDMADDTPEGGWDDTYCEAPYSQVVFGCVGLGLTWREGDTCEAQSVLKPRVILRKVYKLQSWA
ncbi:hypothetical protein BYT27DRAFT_7213105 [Phlegmacium glaucopus]|nr:hypothetical protein BYT27DRAFT_7213105 [Phlegmacium glaucopus]